MVEAKILSELIGDLYDAALDPAQWPAALNTLSGFVGGQSAGIAYIDRPSKAVDAHHTVGCDPHFLQLYLSRYGQFDPTLGLLLLPTSCLTMSIAMGGSTANGHGRKAGSIQWAPRSTSRTPVSWS